ncbi:hypothetical protein HDV00_006061 [Rhizophlyctis rosea]|nr:hypothetical protein HDV00_006061 [Rhizophlyctis rosea]
MFRAYGAHAREGQPLHQAMQSLNRVFARADFIAEYGFLLRGVPKDKSALSEDEIGQKFMAVMEGGIGTAEEIRTIRDFCGEGLELMVTTPTAYNDVLMEEFEVPEDSEALLRDDDAYIGGWYCRGINKFTHTIFINEQYLEVATTAHQKELLAAFLTVTVCHEFSHFVTTSAKIDSPIDPWLPDNKSELEFESGEQVELNLFANVRIKPWRIPGTYELKNLLALVWPEGKKVFVTAAVIDELVLACITRRSCGTLRWGVGGKVLGQRGEVSLGGKDVKNVAGRDAVADSVKHAAARYMEQRKAGGEGGS